MIKEILEALFPVNYTCDICGVETFGGENLCPDCKKRVKFNDGTTCPVCGRKTVRPEICLECKAEPPAYWKGVSALLYEDDTVKLIYKFKRGSAYLKEYFADLLVPKISALPPYDAIVYVPMLEKDVRKRGYNQGKLLAYAISERTGVPVLDNAIIKVKASKLQKSLTHKERMQNLNGCFKAEKEVKDKQLLLVDDVLTTGATADTITKVLLKAGAKTVCFAAVASVVYNVIKTENASDI